MSLHHILPQWACCVLASALLLCSCSKTVDSSDDSMNTAESATAAFSAQNSDITDISADNTSTLKAEDVPTVLPETEDAGRSYIDGTLFLGDSNTVRYTMYGDDTNTAFTTLDNDIGVVSMSAGQIKNLKCEQFKGSSTLYTMPDAVAKLKPQRVVICFGTNNLSGSSTDATKFIAAYLEGIQAIEEAWPYADIIVSAIPPLDQQRENTNLTMTQVDAYNEAIIEMCEENGYHFLNSSEALKDEKTGWAKKDYTLSDGVHLSKEGVTAYFEYVRTHALLTEDRRPQPLGDIPTPEGTPANLISSDPIAVRGAKVPVEFIASNGGTLSGSTSQNVKKGSTCSTVTAVADDGFVFSYWSISTGGTSGSFSISFTVPSSANANGVVLTAHFEAAEHDHDWQEIGSGDTWIAYRCSICGEEKETQREVTVTPTPTPVPTAEPTEIPTTAPTAEPTAVPTAAPTEVPHQHSYQLVSSQPATCGQNGSNTYTCSCGDTYTETIPSTGNHTPVTNSDGSITCSVCGTLLQAAPQPTPAPQTEEPVVEPTE